MNFDEDYSLAWHVFVHAFRQVFGNFVGALHVSLVLMLAQFAIYYFFVLRSPELMMLLANPTALRYALQNGTFPHWQLAGVAFAQMVMGLWMVVGWHRYILLNERPFLIPTLRPGRILGYFGASLVFGLMMALLGLILAVVLGFILPALLYNSGAANGNNAVFWILLIAALIYLPLIYIFTRLSVALPGFALEPGTPLMIGWTATRNAPLTIIGVILISGVFGLIMYYIGYTLFEDDPLGLGATIFNFALQWFLTMLGASILTTLYGVYVEGRELV